MSILRKKLINDISGVTCGTGTMTVGSTSCIYYWIKYGNTLLEQGGYVSGSPATQCTITFPIAFANLYNVLLTTNVEARQHSAATTRSVANASNTKFTANSQWGAGGDSAGSSSKWAFYWRAIGTPIN